MSQTKAPKRKPKRDVCATCHRPYLLTRDVRLMAGEHPHCKTCHQTTDNSLNLQARL